MYKKKRKKKQNKTARYSLSPPRHAAIYLQKLHLHTSPPHLLINPLKCSSDISDLSSPAHKSQYVESGVDPDISRRRSPLLFFIQRKKSDFKIIYFKSRIKRYQKLQNTS